MNNSDGKFTNHGKHAGSDIYATLMDKKHDMLSLFKQHRKYSWFFENLDSQKKRFTSYKRFLIDRLRKTPSVGSTILPPKLPSD